MHWYEVRIHGMSLCVLLNVCFRYSKTNIADLDTCLDLQNRSQYLDNLNDQSMRILGLVRLPWWRFK